MNWVSLCGIPFFLLHLSYGSSPHVENLKKQSKSRNTGKQKETLSTALPPARISSKQATAGELHNCSPHHPLANDTNDIDSLMDLSFDPSYPFGSQTANLEYSMLSAILGNPSDTQSVNDIPSPMLDNTPSSGQATGWPGVTPASEVYPQAVPPDITRPVLGSSVTPPSATTASTSYLRTLGAPSPPNSTDSPGIRVDPALSSSLDMSQGDSAYGAAAGASSSSGLTDVLPQQNGPGGPSVVQVTAQWRPVGDSAYSQVVAAYDYTQGYHFLMRFLSERSAIPFRFLSRRVSATAASASGDISTILDEGDGHDSSVLRRWQGSTSPRSPDRSRSSFPSAPFNASLDMVISVPKYHPLPSSLAK